MENSTELLIISVAYEGPDYPLWSPLTSGWVVGLVGVAGFITLATKGHFIHYVLTYAPKRRPLNQLFLYDQIVTFISFSILTFMTVLPLIIGQPVATIFKSQTPCYVSWINKLCHYSFNVSNNFGLAFYRLLCMKRETLVVKKGTKVVVYILVVLQIVSFVLICLFIGAYHLSRVNGSFQLCEGQSAVMQDITETYKGRTDEMKKQGLIIMSIVIAVGLGFTLTELMIYAIIAQDRFKQDGNMLGVISGKSSRKRF